MLSILGAVLILGIVSAGNRNVGNLVGGYLLAPVRRLLTSGTGSLEDVLTPPADTEALQERIVLLEEENRRLYDELAGYYDIKAENEALRKYYGIKEADESISLVDIRVIGRDANENFYGFTADKGSRDGVAVNDPVITENGLVGIVSEVALSTCKVTTVCSPSFCAGAEVGRTGDSGLICGSAAVSDNGHTRLINISSQNTLRTGDLVLTSGYGGSFPQGLKAGKIVSLEYDEYTGLPYAVMDPLENIAALTCAAVITDFDGRKQQEEQATE